MLQCKVVRTLGNEVEHEEGVNYALACLQAESDVIKDSVGVASTTIAQNYDRIHYVTTITYKFRLKFNK